MTVNHFLKNWVLHYAQPEYMYLPNFQHKKGVQFIPQNICAYKSINGQLILIPLIQNKTNVMIIYDIYNKDKELIKQCQGIQYIELEPGTYYYKTDAIGTIDDYVEFIITDSTKKVYITGMLKGLVANIDIRMKNISWDHYSFESTNKYSSSYNLNSIEFTNVNNQREYLPNFIIYSDFYCYYNNQKIEPFWDYEESFYIKTYSHYIIGIVQDVIVNDDDIQIKNYLQTVPLTRPDSNYTNKNAKYILHPDSESKKRIYYDSTTKFKLVTDLTTEENKLYIKPGYSIFSGYNGQTDAYGLLAQNFDVYNSNILVESIRTSVNTKNYNYEYHTQGGHDDWPIFTTYNDYLTFKKFDEAENNAFENCTLDVMDFHPYEYVYIAIPDFKTTEQHYDGVNNIINTEEADYRFYKWQVDFTKPTYTEHEVISNIYKDILNKVDESLIFDQYHIEKVYHTLYRKIGSVDERRVYIELNVYAVNSKLQLELVETQVGNSYSSKIYSSKYEYQKYELNDEGEIIDDIVTDREVYIITDEWGN